VKRLISTIREAFITYELFEQPAQFFKKESVR
jgi:hypothetical protein